MKTHLAAFVVCLASLLHSFVASAANALSDVAKRHFDAGVAYVDDPNGPKWEEALKEFRAAYADSPTWKLLNNIGLCALNLERDGEAIEAYQEYLANGGEEDLSPKARKQIEKDIATLSASLVRVTIDAEPAEVVVIDERRNNSGNIVSNQYRVKAGHAILGLHPGLHRFMVQAPGYVSAEWSFDADPASTHSHRFKLEPEKRTEPAAPGSPARPSEPAETSLAPSTSTGRTPTAVYVGLALTGVFAASATTTGIISQGKKSDYDRATNRADGEELEKSGKTFALLTDIAIGAAVLSAGATAYFYFSAPKPEKTLGARVRWIPVASPKAAGLAMAGQF